MYISNKRIMFVAQNFIGISFIQIWQTYSLYHGGTWYFQACTFLHLKHRLHSSLEKCLIERVMQYFKVELRVLMFIILVDSYRLPSSSLFSERIQMILSFGNWFLYLPLFSNNQRRNCDSRTRIQLDKVVHLLV